MVIYMHPNGQADFRAPAKVIVGPVLSYIGGIAVISVGKTCEELKDMAPYQYQQLQLGI